MKTAVMCVSLGVLVGILLDPRARNSAAVLSLVLVLSLSIAFLAILQDGTQGDD